MEKLFFIQPMKSKTRLDIDKERLEVMEALGIQMFNEAGEQLIEILENFFDVYPPIDAPDLEGAQLDTWAFSTNIARMAQADKVIIMPGWESAKGCIIEYEIAAHYGLNMQLVQRRF